MFSNFLYYSILRELQGNNELLEKNFYLTLIKRNILQFEIRGTFRTTYLQALHLILDIEERDDTTALIMDVMKNIVGDSIINDDLRYDLIENLHMKLYSNNYKVKKTALALIFALTKSQEYEFTVVFKKMMERCIETQNEELIRLFIENLSDMKLVLHSDRICQYVAEVIHNPIFSNSRDIMLSLMNFLDNVICSTPVIDKSLSKTMFVFFCKHMRSLYVDIRKKSIAVFSRMNLRQIDEQLLSMCLKRETFADYASATAKQKRSQAYQNRRNGHSPYNRGNHHHHSHHHHHNIHNNTEKTVNSLEIKSLTDNVIKGAIQHMLEDELPDIRIHAIEALVSLGKIFNASKNE